MAGNSPLFYGLFLWSVSMVCFYGLLLWSVSMVCFYGLFLWSVSMVCFYPEQIKKGLPAASYSPTDSLRSTIGAGGLNCRVRHGTGCDPSAVTTGNPIHVSP